MSENKFHIVADENAVGLQEIASQLGSFDLLPVERIDAHALQQANALIIRSVTRVDHRLLEGTPVQFVGSATAGVDHVDEKFLRDAGIAFSHAPASNAVSVVEYVLAALLVLCSREQRLLDDLVVGVVGCGNVGSRLADRLELLGVRVLRNDPPRARAEEGFVTLDTVLKASDVITLHTPLEHAGPFPTHHLIDDGAFERMRPGVWFINAARGPVVDTAALIRAIDAGKVRHAVVDTWEGEPSVSLELLGRATIGTPHIAGYSYDSKLLGSRMVVEAMADYFGFEIDLGPLQTDDKHLITPPDPALDVVEASRYAVGQMYDILADDTRLREALFNRPTLNRPPLNRPTPRDQNATASHSAAFRELRRTYPRRYSFGRYGIDGALLRPGIADVLTRLGLHVELEAAQVR